MESTLKPILRSFIAQETNIRAIAVVKTNGKKLISVLPDNLQQQENTLISRILESLTQKVSHGAIQANIENILVCCDQGYGILSRCNYDTILLTLMNVNGVEKIPFLSIKKVSINIAEEMSLAVV